MPFVLALVLVSAAPLRIGDDGFRIGQAIHLAVPSADGRLFAVAGEGGGVHLMDARTGTIRHSWHDCPQVHDLAFDAVGHLLVLQRNGWLRTYAAADGRLVREVLIHDSGPRDLPRSRILAGRLVHISCGPPLREIRTGAEVHLPVSENEPAVSGDGRWIASVTPPPRRGLPGNLPDRPTGATGLTLHDRTTGRAWTHPATDEAGFGHPVFRPDGRALFVTIEKKPVILDLDSQQFTAANFDDWPESCECSPVWSPDGRRLALVRSNGSRPLRIDEWDATSGKILRSQELAAREGPRLAYTTDGRLLYWSESGIRLAIHEMGRPETHPSMAHLRALTSVAFADTQTLVTLDGLGHCCRWHIPTGLLLSQGRLPGEIPIGGKPAAAGGWSLAPSGRTALLMTADGVARFDLQAGEMESVSQTSLAPDAVSPDGRWLLEWQEKECRLVDTQRRRETLTLAEEKLWPEGRDRTIRSIWSPDGRWLALVQARIDLGPSGRQHRLEIPIVKLPAGRVISRIELTTDAFDVPPFFSADGSTLFVGCDGRVLAFDPATGSLRTQYRPRESARWYPFAVSPDGRLLLVAEVRQVPSDAVLAVIELASGTARRRIPLPAGSLWSVPPRFSPDGRWIALALPDATVLLEPTSSDVAMPPDRADVWRDLAGLDAACADAAVRALAADPDAVRQIRARYRESTPHDFPVLFWLSELEHDDPERRDTARRHLASRSDVLPPLESLPSPSAELRRALTELAETPFQKAMSRDTLRQERWREVLDRIATPDALALRHRIR